MQINEDLLLKYTTGQCTTAECVRVENWLSTVSQEEIDQFAHLFEPSREKILKRIHDEMDETLIGKPSYLTTMVKAGVSICLAIIFFGVGTFFPYNSNNGPALEMAQTEQPEERAIYISTISGRPQKVSASTDNYDILFEGSVRLYSIAETERTITCNGKEITLRPNKAVYLMSSPSQGFFQLNDPLAFEDASGDGAISKFYRVCVKS